MLKQTFLGLLLTLVINLKETKGQKNLRKPCAPNRDGEIEVRSNQVVNSLQSVVTNKTTFCVNGKAAGFDCNAVDLESFINITDLSGGQSPRVIGGGLTDIWGWTSPSGIEYALVGVRSGTIFIDISNPANPLVLGRLPSHSRNSNWSDIKTYKNHAYIVSEARAHGMIVYDLMQLDSLPRKTPRRILQETSHFDLVSNSHNLIINEDSGFAYIVGSNQCGGGLFMVDITIPKRPIFAGCFANDGYVHDAQCVNYNGPDIRYVGREICFCSNEDTLTIVDVTEKFRPRQLSKLSYRWSSITYTHQGWLTEDKKLFLLDDELKSGNTATYVIDVIDLKIPKLKTLSCQQVTANAHNQYVKGHYVYQSNYHAGLRILDIDSIKETGSLGLVGNFDTYPKDDEQGMDGAWGNYPYFESNVTIISSIAEGFFVVRPHFTYESATTVRNLHAEVVDDLDLNNNFSQSVHITATVYDHNQSPVNGATVTGAFYYGIKETSCITNNVGMCTIKSEGFSNGVNDITFTVKGIVYPRHRYEKKTNNHTSIRVTKDGSNFNITKSKQIPMEYRKKSNSWVVSKISQLLRNKVLKTSN